MDTRELLMQLEKLESGLNSFSFTELKTSEASKLKQSFESFKTGLEEKVFGVPSENLGEDLSVRSLEAGPSPESQLIANVSHELRTPLNGIIGFLDLLQETELSSNQSQLVNALGAASNNLLELINELLEFSKLASGREKFEKVPINLSNLVNEVAFLSKTLINGKDVQFLVNYDENIPKLISGDPSKLSQLLLNLTGNAIKFVEKGEIRLDIKLKEQNSKRVFLEFLVADTGIGIANDQLKHIFESYRQAEPSTKLKYGGSGLGLSIVKEIVEKQNGCIAVSSQLGVGTTFKVIMPFERIQKANSQPSKSPSKSIDYDISGKRILVFEDDSLTQRLMENRLEQWGCRSYITDNGLFGLQLLENHQVDLVLLDMRLPGFSGIDIAKKIRANKKFEHLPIIALSADANFVERHDLKKYGIIDFVLKPYHSGELIKKIHNNIKTMNQNVTSSQIDEIENKDNRSLPLVDLNPILGECLGKTELLDELIRLFEQNVLEFIGKTKMHLQSRNLQGVGFAVHKIKSSLKMLHASSLIAICEEMTNECQTSNNINRLQTLFEAFVAEYPKVEMLIGLELKRLKYEL